VVVVVVVVKIWSCEVWTKVDGKPIVSIGSISIAKDLFRWGNGEENSVVWIVTRSPYCSTAPMSRPSIVFLATVSSSSSG